MTRELRVEELFGGVSRAKSEEHLYSERFLLMHHATHASQKTGRYGKVLVTFEDHYLFQITSNPTYFRKKRSSLLFRVLGKALDCVPDPAVYRVVR